MRMREEEDPLLLGSDQHAVGSSDLGAWHGPKYSISFYDRVKVEPCGHIATVWKLSQ